MPEESVLRMVARLVDETTAPLRNMTRAFFDFKHVADTEGTTARFKGLSGAVKGFGSSINEFAQPALSSFGITAGISAASVIGLTKVVADYARGVVDLKDSAAIMNMSTGSVMGWDRAMRSVGIEGGVKSMENFSGQLLKMKNNIEGVQEDWENRGLGRLFRQVQSAARIGDTNKALELMYDHLQKLQTIDPARAEVFAQWWMGQPAAKLLAARERQKNISPEDAAKAAEQAEKLNKTMSDFWDTWDKFYQQTMTSLIPGVDKMMQGMIGGFNKLPEAWDKFLSSPAGKLLAAMVPKVDEDKKFDKEGNLKPPPELPPEEADPAKERELQKQRNAAGGAIPSLLRAGQEIGDLIRFGKVQRRTETQPIVFHPERIFQGPGTNEAGGVGDPFSSEAWKSYGETPEGKALPASVRQQQPTDKPAFMQQPIIVPPAAPQVDPFKFNPASGNVEYTEPPASGADVKDGAKEGIIAGMADFLARYVLTPAGRQDLGLKDPIQDVKRTPTDIKNAVDVMTDAASDGEDSFGALGAKRVVEPYSKPGLEQESKASDAARRLQQSATEQLLTQPPSEKMRSLVDLRTADNQDEKLGQRLMQQAQLAPINIDQITQALSGNKVEGSATLKVDIAAPAGTRTSVSADGLFRQTEISRRRAFQMEKTAFNDGFE